MPMRLECVFMTQDQCDPPSRPSPSLSAEATPFIMADTRRWLGPLPSGGTSTAGTESGDNGPSIPSEREIRRELIDFSSSSSSRTSVLLQRSL